MIAATGRFGAKIFLIVALLVVGVLAVSATHPGPAGMAQGMGGGHQTALAGNPVCKTVTVSIITLSIATLTTGITLQSIVNGVVGYVLSPFISGTCDFYSSLISWSQGQSFILTTGNLITYDQPTVAKMHDALLPVTAAVIALLFAMAGHRIILGANPLRVLPRIILVSVLAAASPLLLKKSIDLNNGLCELVLGAAVQNRPGENFATLFLMGTNPLDLGSINWIGAEIILLMGIGVSLQALVRVGVLDVLWVIGPLVLLLYAEPAWQRWANLWTCAWIATVFTQFLQVVVICLGASLVGNFGGLTPVAMLVGIAILFLVMKVPGWLSSAVSNTLVGVPSTYEVAANAIKQTGEAALQLVKTIAVLGA